MLTSVWLAAERAKTAVIVEDWLPELVAVSVLLKERGAWQVVAS